MCSFHGEWRMQEKQTRVFVIVIHLTPWIGTSCPCKSKTIKKTCSWFFFLPLEMTTIPGLKEWLGGGNSNIFYFHLYLGKIPILTSIFFRWVGSTTNQMVFSEKSFKLSSRLGLPGCCFWLGLVVSLALSKVKEEGKKTGNFGFPFVQCYQGGLNHHPKLLVRSRFGGSKDFLELFLTLMNLGEKILQSNQLKSFTTFTSFTWHQKPPSISWWKT